MTAIPINPVRAYFDKAAISYERRYSRPPWSWIRRMETRALGNLLGQIELAPRRVLDVGCGDGFYASQLLPSLGGELTCLDFSSEMLSKLRTRVQNVNIWHADFSQPLAGEPFDLIFCAGALEFLPDLQVAFANFGRLLEPGGTLVLLAPRPSFLGNLYRAYHRRNGVSVALLDEARWSGFGVAAGLHLKETVQVPPFNLAPRYRRV